MNQTGYYVQLIFKGYLVSEKYKIYGAELSPYSVKTRSYFRYKNIPHEWLVRSPSNAEEFQKYRLVIKQEQSCAPCFEKYTYSDVKVRGVFIYVGTVICNCLSFQH